MASQDNSTPKDRHQGPNVHPDAGNTACPHFMSGETSSMNSSMESEGFPSWLISLHQELYLGTNWKKC